MKPQRTLRSVVVVDGSSETDVSIPESDFRQLYEHRDRLYRAIALVVGDPSLASDAVDEAMTRAVARWERISKYDSPDGWVYRVALTWSRRRYGNDAEKTCGMSRQSAPPMTHSLIRS